MIKYLLFVAVIISCNSKHDSGRFKIVIHPNDTFWIGNEKKSLCDDTTVARGLSLQRVIDSIIYIGDLKKNKILDSFVYDGESGGMNAVPETTGYAYRLAKDYGWPVKLIPIKDRKWNTLLNTHNVNSFSTDANGRFDMGRGPNDSALYIGSCIRSQEEGNKPIQIDENNFTDSFYIEFEGQRPSAKGKKFIDSVIYRNLKSSDTILYQLIKNIPIYSPPKGVSIFVDGGVNTEINE